MELSGHEGEQSSISSPFSSLSFYCYGVLELGLSGCRKKCSTLTKFQKKKVVEITNVY